jgi:hypothetical protein
MAKHDIDPVLQQLAQAINESGQAAAPIVVSVHGTVLGLNGSLQQCRLVTLPRQRYMAGTWCGVSCAGRGQAPAWPVAPAAQGPSRSPGSRPARRAVAAGDAQQP